MGLKTYRASAFSGCIPQMSFLKTKVEDTGMIYLPTKNPWTMIENPARYVSDPALVEKAISVSKGIRFSKVMRENGSFFPVVTKGIIVTGDVFVASETATHRLRKDLNAAATELEGAAIAQTCFQQNIPFSNHSKSER